MKYAMHSHLSLRTKVVVFLVALATLFLIGSQCVWAAGAKNVIIMIADGAGFHSYYAGSMYEGKWDSAKGASTQVYDGPGWLKYGCSTYPLSTADKPRGTCRQEAALVYQPSLVWKTSPMKIKITTKDAKGVVTSVREETRFAGYHFLMRAATDSAAAATALATGEKTYNSAINWGDDNRPRLGRALPEIAKRLGKSCGAITTVPWSHATPAGLGGAHNPDRDNYAAIAKEMLSAGTLDVIMGTGNPDFDDDGRPVAKHDPKKIDKIFGYVGGQQTWQTLKAGKHPAGWRLIQSKADFEAAARGELRATGRLLGTPQVFSTLQQARGKFKGGDTPFSQPLNATVPDLATMTRAAIGSLAANPKGFYLMIEGGAVDWANHANQPARMIEEQVDFHRAVEAVVAWVESKSNWNETLVIISADHETGMIWGPNAATTPFDPIVTRGKGKMPELSYGSKSHTNSLVPLFCRGPGSERFAGWIKGTDVTAGRKFGFSGQYVDDTDIFRAAEETLLAQ